MNRIIIYIALTVCALTLSVHTSAIDNSFENTCHKSVNTDTDLDNKEDTPFDCLASSKIAFNILSTFNRPFSINQTPLLEFISGIYPIRAPPIAN